MTPLNASIDELVAELARRLRTPEPLIRTRVGLPFRPPATPPSGAEARPYRDDGWSWAGNGS